ncbi:SipW-dependent-type signal peptide-containing protein [Streptacidiphilus sp. ASG 303]|uniref:TasA family protein n=1 Tax=Streptacidiphilus sp. ASG 303 TaxID=2896847 RepID=UPI001E50B3EB|nr:TasA family protein [Streptacidiphilus sp. ASG 303]MCD0482999.1 SipW-dependent-type signal peptide-containing protein [Streptacidiphilus sp. ASG 303]
MSVFRSSRKVAALAGSVSLAAAAVAVTGGTYAWFTDTQNTGSTTVQTGTLTLGSASTTSAPSATDLVPGSPLPTLSAVFSGGGSLSGKVRLALHRDGVGSGEEAVRDADLKYFHLHVAIERRSSTGRDLGDKEFDIDLDDAFAHSLGPNGPQSGDVPYTRTDGDYAGFAEYFRLDPGDQQRVTVTGRIDEQAGNSIQGKSLAYSLTATLIQLQAPDATVAG